MPSSEIQVKSSRCWSPFWPESKSASTAIESANVAKAKTIATRPARKTPQRQSRAAARPPATGRKTRTDSISPASPGYGSLSLAHHQEVESQAADPDQEQQGVVAHQARLGDPDDRVADPDRERGAPNRALGDHSLEGARRATAERPERLDEQD